MVISGTTNQRKHLVKTVLTEITTIRSDLSQLYIGIVV